MVSLEDSVIARFETGGNRFEILVDPKAAQEYNEGGDIDWEDAIAADGIWSDSSKGERAPDILVNNTFESLDLIKIYKIMIEKRDGDGRLPHERMTAFEKIRAPVYEWFPLDFFSEMVWPREIEDDHILSYDLVKLNPPPIKEQQEKLLKNAEELRQRVNAPDF